MEAILKYRFDEISALYRYETNTGIIGFDDSLDFLHKFVNYGFRILRLPDVVNIYNKQLTFDF